MPDRLRVFLDANVLFSASYKPEHRFRQFWRLTDVVVLTSMYVANEARRNSVDASHLTRLENLLEQTHLVSDALQQILPDEIFLPVKDRPVLAAAIRAGADHLITGDKNHFGKWMGVPVDTAVGTLTIRAPGEFLDSHIDRI